MKTCSPSKRGYIYILNDGERQSEKQQQQQPNDDHRTQFDIYTQTTDTLGEEKKKKQSATQPRHQLSLNNIKNREKKKKHRILLGVIVRLNLLYDYKERKQNGAACTL